MFFKIHVCVCVISAMLYSHKSSTQWHILWILLQDFVHQFFRLNRDISKVTCFSQREDVSFQCKSP